MIFGKAFKSKENWLSVRIKYCMYYNICIVAEEDKGEESLKSVEYETLKFQWC